MKLKNVIYSRKHKKCKQYNIKKLPVKYIHSLVEKYFMYNQFYLLYQSTTCKCSGTNLVCLSDRGRPGSSLHNDDHVSSHQLHLWHVGQVRVYSKLL